MDGWEARTDGGRARGEGPPSRRKRGKGGATWSGMLSGKRGPASENGWGACSWPEPTLPQKAREGWGNLVRDVEWEGWDGPQLKRVGDTPAGLKASGTKNMIPAEKSATRPNYGLSTGHEREGPHHRRGCCRQADVERQPHSAPRSGSHLYAQG